MVPDRYSSSRNLDATTICSSLKGYFGILDPRSRQGSTFRSVELDSLRMSLIVNTETPRRTLFRSRRSVVYDLLLHRSIPGLKPPGEGARSRKVQAGHLWLGSTTRYHDRLARAFVVSGTTNTVGKDPEVSVWMMIAGLRPACSRAALGRNSTQ